MVNIQDVEEELLTVTLNCLPDRYDSSHLSTGPLIPYDLLSFLGVDYD